MLTYNHGFQLDDVRKFSLEGRIRDPVIIHNEHGFTFFFDLAKDDHLFENCVLITVKGARPREFKKAKTYTRLLLANGINRWRVIRQETAFSE